MALWNSGSTYNQGDGVYFPAGVKATGVFTLSSAVAGDSATIAGIKFTAVAAGATGDQFNIGVNDTATAVNLASAINGNWVIGALIIAVGSTNHVNLTANTQGTVGAGSNAHGNNIVLAGSTHLTATAMSGGIDQLNWGSVVDSNNNHQPPAAYTTWNAFWSPTIPEEGYAVPTAQAKVRFVWVYPGVTVLRQNITTHPNKTMNHTSPNSGWMLPPKAPLPVMTPGNPDTTTGYSPGPSGVWQLRLVFRVVRTSWLVGLMSRANKPEIMHNFGVGD